MSVQIVDSSVKTGYLSCMNAPGMTCVRGWMFVALGFLIPLSTAGISIFFGLVVLLSLVDRQVLANLREILKSPVYLAFVAFFLLHLIGQLWTVEPENGFKSWMIFLIPVLAASISKEFAVRGVYAFAFGMMVAETWSYYEIFSNWTAYSAGQYSNDIYISMGHVSYNPVLAVAISLLMTTLLAGKYQGLNTILPLLFLITMIVNMFMTGGRAGHVGFMFSWMVLAAYFFWRKPVALLGMTVLLLSIVWSAYSYSPIFQQRVSGAVNEVQAAVITTDQYQQKDENDHGRLIDESKLQSSVGFRIAYAMHSWDIFLHHPWFGSGTGSFESAYKNYRQTHESPVMLTANPHNNHLLILVQFGVLGLVVYGAIFVGQLLEVRRMPVEYEFRAVALLLPLFFGLISFYDSYLWGHHTQALFAFLTAVLYRRDIYQEA